MRHKQWWIVVPVVALALWTTQASSHAQAPGVVIRGDIFANQKVGGVTFAGPSVVTAKNTANISGSPTLLTNYTPSSSQDFTNIQSTIQASVSQLEKQRGRQLLPGQPLPVTIGGVGATYNLNPSVPLFGIDDPLNINNVVNDVFHPEGSLWTHTGDMTINALTFRNRGAIVVHGNVTINGNLNYNSSTQQDSFGLIVFGNLTFTPTAQNVVGAYFATGTITVN